MHNNNIVNSYKSGTCKSQTLDTDTGSDCPSIEVKDSSHWNHWETNWTLLCQGMFVAWEAVREAIYG